MAPTDPAESVDLVIPVYNEAHVLADSVQRLAGAMQHCAVFRWRIVIVDNDSVDGTQSVGERLAATSAEVQYLRLDQKGRGRALRHTWMCTDADYSIYMDVDLSTELEAIPRTVACLREGADIVTGSRFDPDSHVVRCLKREILSRAYVGLIRLVLGTRSFRDAQCGFKGIRVASVRRLLPIIRNQNWFFDTELLVLAEYAGLRIRSIPITWVEDADSRVNIPRTVYEDLKGLARLRWTARRLMRDWKTGLGDTTAGDDSRSTDGCETPALSAERVVAQSGCGADVQSAASSEHQAG